MGVRRNSPRSRRHALGDRAQVGATARRPGTVAASRCRVAAEADDGGHPPVRDARTAAAPAVDRGAGAAPCLVGAAGDQVADGGGAGAVLVDRQG